MALAQPGIEVVGLAELRRALRASGSGLTRELPKALRLAGKPPLDKARSLAGRTSSSPRSTGALQRSYKIRTAGTSAFLASSVPYGAGAEWGLYGKWAGFRKYPGVEAGGRGRFAWAAVLTEREAITAVLTRALEDLLRLQGWANE